MIIGAITLTIIGATLGYTHGIIWSLFGAAMGFGIYLLLDRFILWITSFSDRS